MSGLYIRRFIDRIQALDNKGVNDFIWPMADAKNLHGDITKLLLDIETLKNQPVQEEPTTIEVSGGNF